MWCVYPHYHVMCIPSLWVSKDLIKPQTYSLSQLLTYPKYYAIVSMTEINLNITKICISAYVFVVTNYVCVKKWKRIFACTSSYSDRGRHGTRIKCSWSECWRIINYRTQNFICESSTAFKTIAPIQFCTGTNSWILRFPELFLNSSTSFFRLLLT